MDLETLQLYCRVRASTRRDRLPSEYQEFDFERELPIPESNSEDEESLRFSFSSSYSNYSEPLRTYNCEKAKVKKRWSAVYEYRSVDLQRIEFNRDIKTNLSPSDSKLRCEDFSVHHIQKHKSLLIPIEYEKHCNIYERSPSPVASSTAVLERTCDDEQKRNESEEEECIKKEDIKREQEIVKETTNRANEETKETKDTEEKDVEKEKRKDITDENEEKINSDEIFDKNNSKEISEKNKSVKSVKSVSVKNVKAKKERKGKKTSCFGFFKRK